jgi:hypothetical protein
METYEFLFFQIKFFFLEERDGGSGGTSRVTATHQARVHDDLQVFFKSYASGAEF